MLTDDKIRCLPAHTIGIWAMVAVGINPKRKMSEQTYQKHRMVLRSHGIDIEPEVKKLQGKPA